MLFISIKFLALKNTNNQKFQRKTVLKNYQTKMHRNVSLQKQQVRWLHVGAAQ